MPKRKLYHVGCYVYDKEDSTFMVWAGSNVLAEELCARINEWEEQLQMAWEEGVNYGYAHGESNCYSGRE